MRIVALAILSTLALSAPVAAAAQDPESGEIVVNGEVARAEIERILREDNLDADRLSPREIVEIMSGIARGRAPQDFWTAYQAHLEAWQRYAAAIDQAAQQQGDPSFGLDSSAGEAEQAISTTFNEVERIALRYGARLPAPRVNPREIA